MDKKYQFKLCTADDDNSSGTNITNNTSTFTFYQICRFPIDKTYCVRKLTINNEYAIIKSREKCVTKSEIKKFIKRSPKYKFTIYPTFNFENVGYPDPEEILTAHSSILND